MEQFHAPPSLTLSEQHDIHFFTHLFSTCPWRICLQCRAWKLPTGGSSRQIERSRVLPGKGGEVQEQVTLTQCDILDLMLLLLFPCNT